MTALILLSDWQKSQIEFWRKIEGFPGYDVSSFGNVRRWWCRKKGGKRGECVIGTTAKIVGQTKQWQGYVRVYLYRPGLINSAAKNGCQNRSCHFLHRIVARAFTENLNGLPEVNHKSGVKSDCRSDNLEWATRQMNMEHAQSMKRFIGLKKLRPNDVTNIRARISSGEKYATIAADVGVSWRSIYNIAAGHTHRAA